MEFVLLLHFTKRPLDFLPRDSIVLRITGVAIGRPDVEYHARKINGSECVAPPNVFGGALASLSIFSQKRPS